MLPFLVTFCNTILERKSYPENWSCGIITPIHKLEEDDNPDNCKGITMVVSVSFSIFSIFFTTGV